MQNNIFSGLFIGQNLVILKEVDSTNTFLKNMASNSKPVPEGTVIMAEHQFAGRGQQQNGWFTEAGKNLSFSILLKPTFLQADEQFALTQVVSLGVVKALQNVAGNDIKIKWPNDIYYGDKKLGGILIENSLQGTKINYSVVGIGLNINQETFPPHLPGAISLYKILHRDYDLKALLSDICSHIEGYYLQLKSGKLARINEQYLSNLYRINKEMMFRSAGEVFNGIITGVTARGLLKIDADNEPKEYNLKEIEFLINP
ncbi:biotin--[acetyl-CoA-carboxylase] ligase [Mucilaginibacter ginkgonis]|uniref:Biotin--[acetyl-CoA-carboxylase] ligase n=1 Tax=Mucilaginibacter ginkgonis TaxID=2682091 RepID=A0A6I4HZ66_9SPHI|nr:biotin--[acetyl-CoA-carboxylase] ligase [Mucilaginibacter ginkgonis]QQL49284.1 biotin--[acetyl-CoA-carboxylase] ligase [Mucilaginibacter ginkgonis]